MSDEEDQGEEKPFAAEIAKQGRAVCKKCKQKCLQGELRIAKLVFNPFGAGKMKSWHHPNCIFELFLKQRQATKRIEGPDDIDGWDLLNEDDQNDILKKVEQSEKAICAKFGLKYSPKKQKSSTKVNTSLTNKTPKKKTAESKKLHASTKKGNKDDICKDHLFKEFRRLVADISNVSSYTDKTNLVQKVFSVGSDGTGFKGDIVLWCKLLLPGVVKRVYNLQSKQLIKLFSRIFQTDQNSMLEHLEQGDIGETIQHFFTESKLFKPAKKSLLKIQEIDEFLEELTQITKEDEQVNHFKTFASLCTANDLKIIVRLIKHDLRMNAGAKHILDGVHPDAYQAFQSSRDIEVVIQRCLGTSSKISNSSIKATINIMTPVLPMLAEACKSVEYAMKKCVNGMYSEIKYDGERVQVHKHGSEFKYFSRSLKPVLQHKVAHFKNYIPKAFPHAKDLILDSEILMIDTNTGKPLPFGTLGIHKKTEFKDACVCLFVFDCIYYNGESLTDKPIQHRKQILQENMIEIPNHIVFSEMEEINKPEDLSAMIAKVLKLGLEGLVLKDIMSTYEPGKRHWLKVKKDYLFDGAMADSADLIVLGAWYGTGKKGGMMSVFLMGVYDPLRKKYCTVTKVHTGHDDKTLERLQSELDMVKISSDPSKVPSWLHCTKTMVPDFVARDPKAQPVWEITGAEFTQHDVHTANGISIRFPRVTKIRDDKHWETATNLEELQALYKKSKENTDVSLLMKPPTSDDSNSDKSSDRTSPKRKKIDNVGTTTNCKNKAEKAALIKNKTMFDYMEQDLNKKAEDIANAGNKESKRKLSDPSTHKQKKAKSENDDVEIKKPIPDYFEGVKVILECDIHQKQPELIRYFIAYGGIVLNKDSYVDATHVIHMDGIINIPTITCPTNARHVVIDWIKDTIANESLQDYRPYSVRWDPLDMK